MPCLLPDLTSRARRCDGVSGAGVRRFRSGIRSYLVVLTASILGIRRRSRKSQGDGVDHAAGGTRAVLERRGEERHIFHLRATIEMIDQWQVMTRARVEVEPWEGGFATTERSLLPVAETLVLSAFPEHTRPLFVRAARVDPRLGLGTGGTDER